MSQHTGPSARSPGFPREGREAIQRPLLPSLHVSPRIVEPGAFAAALAPV